MESTEEIKKELKFSIRHVKKLMKLLPREKDEYLSCKSLLEKLLSLQESIITNNFRN